MAPPTRLRPHLNDLLQKNLELEHVVADLRHQLTQSSAKWADERKMLAMGCDALMASFAKFRARLDVQPPDWGDSEGEVEQNLDAGRRSEETGEVDNVVPETEKDQGALATVNVHERCRTLAAELREKEEELEESRRKHGAIEGELQRVQRLLDTRYEQLRAVLAPSKADTSNEPSPVPTPDDTLTQTNHSTDTELESALEKLDLANREISRLKQLLQEWKKYGSDWKRDSKIARVRASQLQRSEDELNAQIKAAEENKALQNAEIQRLTGALADQTAAVEHQRTACQGSLKRVHDLESVIARLRAQLSPEQLASFDSEPSQVVSGQPDSNQSPTPDGDTDTNKRNDPIVLRIPYPYRGNKRRLSTEDNRSQEEQQNVASSHQVPASQCVRVSPAPQRSNNPGSFNPTEFEICIHTCNAFPCRNDSRSFLWPRRQPSLPRHVLSTKRHHRCSPDCPGYRLLKMPLADAMKEPRRAKCRPPTEAELNLAAEEALGAPGVQQTGENGTGVEGGNGREGSGGPEGADEPEGGSTREEEAREKGEGQLLRIGVVSAILGKRPRSRKADGEERSRKLRPRASMIAKP